MLDIQPYYQDDHATIYHANCLDLLPLIEEVDHVITDPPYEEEAHTNQRKIKRNDQTGKTQIVAEPIPFDKMDEATRSAIGSHVARVCNRWAITFCQFEAVHAWREVYTPAMTHIRIGHWFKPDGMPQVSGDRPSGSRAEALYICHAKGRGRMRWNGGGQSAIYHVNKNERGMKKNPHPTTKPLVLMGKIILHFTDPHELILDCFGGSGSTAIAAKLHNRRCIMIEQNIKYCEIAAQRLQKVKPNPIYVTSPQYTQAAIEV